MGQAVKQTVEKRARLLLDIVEAITSIFGGDRVAVRIGPNGRWNGMGDSDPRTLFDHVAQELNRFASLIFTTSSRA